MEEREIRAILQRCFPFYRHKIFCDSITFIRSSAHDHISFSELFLSFLFLSLSLPFPLPPRLHKNDHSSWNLFNLTVVIEREYSRA